MAYKFDEEAVEIGERWTKMLERPRVIKKMPGEEEWQGVIMLARGNGINSFKVRMEPGAPSAVKHAHQYDAVFFILEGKGYEIHDGKKYEWEAGDAVFVHPGGCVHQHFNADPERPAKALVFMLAPAYYSMNLVADGLVELSGDLKVEEFHKRQVWREGAAE